MVCRRGVLFRCGEVFFGRVLGISSGRVMYYLVGREEECCCYGKVDGRVVGWAVSDIGGGG